MTTLARVLNERTSLVTCANWNNNHIFIRQSSILVYLLVHHLSPRESPDLFRSRIRISLYTNMVNLLVRKKALSFLGGIRRSRPRCRGARDFSLLSRISIIRNTTCLLLSLLVNARCAFGTLFWYCVHRMFSS